MQPLERLLNLMAMLLDAGKPLTFEQIRRDLNAYQHEDVASAKRQFERDKDTLRGLGVPIELAPTDVWESEDGYHIPKAQYYLPELSFTPEEVAALFVAAHAPGDREAANAFGKLAMGADAGMLPTPAVAGGVDEAGPHLHAVARAAADRRRVRFRYRAAAGEEAERDVDAWGLLFRKGSWYLVGNDRDRKEIRSFRVSRIRSQVRDGGDAEAPPEGFRPADHVRAGPWGVGEPETSATVAFSPKVAWWAVTGIPGVQVLRTVDDGWTEAEIPAASGDAFASWVLSFGPDARVLGPAALRQAVIDRLKGSGGAG